MKFAECFAYLASRRTDQLVVTSAGNSGHAWWAATHDSTGSFYLDASMSLSTLFASGLAWARPELRVWAFMGDGAFCMNPGMLMVERDMNLPNLTHFLVSNRVYGATDNASLPNQSRNDYATVARGLGLTRVFSFDNIEALKRGFDPLVEDRPNGHTFVVLELESVSRAEHGERHPKFNGPDLKHRFGRHVERAAKCKVFDYPE